MSRVIDEAERLYSRGEFSKALSMLRSSDVPEGEGESWAYYMGLCYARLGEYDDALLYLEQVVTGASGVSRMVQCRLLLAYIYTVTDRLRLADYELREILESGAFEGEDARVYAGLGYLAFRQGQIADAIEQYEKALSIEPDNPTALNSLGFILADAGRDLKKAMVLIRKALDSQPENPAYLDSIGWALHRSGFTERGRLYLEKALRIAPGTKDIKQHLDQMDGGAE